MTSPSALAYRIVSCTSEDAKHPISTIQSASMRSPGWQSGPSPHYPLEIVLVLCSIVDLDAIQFVSHQYRIASRIDLYVAGADRRFQVLGSFQFSDNSHTNCTARELKRASLSGIKAQFIKVSISGCHVNANNPQNQVGLVSLNVIGKGGLLKSQVIPGPSGQNSSVPVDWSDSRPTRAPEEGVRPAGRICGR
jgi:centrosomal protein CEP104